MQARLAQVEADAWEVGESTRRLVAPHAGAVREGLSRLSSIIDELDRREEMAAGLRARTMEQLRQTLAEIEAPPSPPVLPTPVIEVTSDRPPMSEPEPFPTE